MKILTGAALLVGGGILASQSIFAQTFVQNDLYLGFQNLNGGGSADYIINLGAASGIVGQASVVDLSSDFSLSLFNSASLQGASSQILGGVVGAANSAFNSGTAVVYGTALRTSNIGTPALAGSSAPAGLTKQSIDNSTESTLTQLIAPSAGTGLLDSSKSWEAYVEPTLNTSSFYGNAGFNPDSGVNTSSVLYEDLWETSDSGDARGSSGQPYTYVGYFTLDLTSGNSSLTFTPQAVPEPTILALLGGAGLLLLSFRRRFNSKKFVS
ncbi:MAG TPA: PEP-CTERM sorting domain-containing protein [Verrucomicrobiae bacterium]|nr:PEP-CTERM sorting domain-containing protein [Verrucomicrobiae bacterium]